MPRISAAPGPQPVQSARHVPSCRHSLKLIFDLDPGEGVTWEFVAETAIRLRDVLRAEGLKNWPKLTGGKGIHLMAPLAETLTHNAAHSYAKRLAQQFAQTDPDRYVTRRSLRAAPASFSSTISGMDAARLLSAPTLRGHGPAFRSPRQSPGRTSNAG